MKIMSRHQEEELKNGIELAQGTSENRQHEEIEQLWWTGTKLQEKFQFHKRPQKRNKELSQHR